MLSDVFVLVVRSARSGGEKAPGSARRRGQRGQRVHEFFSFFVSFFVWGVDSFLSFFCLSYRSSSLPRSSSVFKKLLSKNTQITSSELQEEESGYKKCCTRFVLEPRIGRSSLARTSAAAAAEGEQHRVQQQRVAAARYG